MPAGQIIRQKLRCGKRYIYASLVGSTPQFVNTLVSWPFLGVKVIFREKYILLEQWFI